MYISKVTVENFRLLKNSTLNLENQQHKDLSLLIGRNNSGKTSFIVLFDKFLKKSGTFGFDDFSHEVRKKILEINEETDIHNLSIKLIFEITYTQDDNLANISEFILDLSPTENKVKLLFECYIEKKKLLKDLSNIEKNEKRYIKKNLGNYLTQRIYTFDNIENIKTNNRSRLIQKEFKTIDNLINCQIIHAKRDVSSSEGTVTSTKVLSNLATKYFNKKSENQLTFEELDDINASILDMDQTLEKKYEKFFNDFLNKSKDFLDMTDLRVVSDLESKGIITNHSKVVYGKEDLALPEHLNGLGYMNILYLLLQLELTKENFMSRKRDINLLFIEEPEAHTHPQLQAIFIEKIRILLCEITSLQTFITTHSSHIVKNCKFEDIRCFINDVDNCNVNIRNFYTDLKTKYGDEEENFKFLNQYLTIESAELFFAEKVIFIEGYTERVLLPYFIKQFDEGKEGGKRLSSQNISIIEIGANAKAFRHFINFLEIKTLIITDIDTTKKVVGEKRTSYHACPVREGTHTSNATIKYFFNSPEFKEESEWNKWFDNLVENKLDESNEKIKVVYQLKENDYHGRSFEEAFINVNLESLIKNVSSLAGINCESKEVLESTKTLDEKTKEILEKKSDFASSLLWNSLTNDIVWQMPLYIRKGLEWIVE